MKSLNTGAIIFFVIALIIVIFSGAVFRTMRNRRQKKFMDIINKEVNIKYNLDYNIYTQGMLILFIIGTSLIVGSSMLKYYVSETMYAIISFSIIVLCFINFIFIPGILFKCPVCKTRKMSFAKESKYFYKDGNKKFRVFFHCKSCDLKVVEEINRSFVKLGTKK